MYVYIGVCLVGEGMSSTSSSGYSVVTDPAPRLLPPARFAQSDWSDPAMSPYPSLPHSDSASALSDTTDGPATPPLAPALPSPAPVWQGAELDFLSARSDDDQEPHRTPTPSATAVARVWPDFRRLSGPAPSLRLEPVTFPSGAPTWVPLGLAAYASDSSNPCAPPPPRPVPPPSLLASLSSSSTPDSMAPPVCCL